MAPSYTSKHVLTHHDSGRDSVKRTKHSENLDCTILSEDAIQRSDRGIDYQSKQGDLTSGRASLPEEIPSARENINDYTVGLQDLQYNEDSYKLCSLETFSDVDGSNDSRHSSEPDGEYRAKWFEDPEYYTGVTMCNEEGSKERRLRAEIERESIRVMDAGNAAHGIRNFICEQREMMLLRRSLFSTDELEKLDLWITLISYASQYPDALFTCDQKQKAILLKLISTLQAKLAVDGI